MATLSRKERGEGGGGRRKNQPGLKQWHAPAGASKDAGVECDTGAAWGKFATLLINVEWASLGVAGTSAKPRPGQAKQKHTRPTTGKWVAS
jgi:hypothetical protein